MKYVIGCILLLTFYTSKAQDLSQIYEKVNEAVVVIFTEKKDTKIVNGVSNTVYNEGLGSGFTISDTQIVTAAHVIDVVESLNVKFLDGEIIPAKIITSFDSADVALIELAWPRKNAVTVKFANSDLLKIGEQVFIVGAPFGLGHSLSSGHVSGIIKRKEGTNLFTNTEYIQTDAAINTGNSGGPMFNLNGEVIGVVSHILTKSGGFSGVGFASSSNITKSLLLENSILWGGADFLPLTGKMAKSFNIPQNSGLLVQKVVFLSNMGKMGLKGGDIKAVINGKEVLIGGDIILAFNDIKFDITDESLKKIGDLGTTLKENSPFELTILRGGRIIKLKKN